MPSETPDAAPGPGRTEPIPTSAADTPSITAPVPEVILTRHPMLGIVAMAETDHFKVYWRIHAAGFFHISNGLHVLPYGTPLDAAHSAVEHLTSTLARADIAFETDPLINYPLRGQPLSSQYSPAPPSLSEGIRAFAERLLGRFRRDRTAVGPAATAASRTSPFTAEGAETHQAKLFAPPSPRPATENDPAGPTQSASTNRAEAARAASGHPRARGQQVPASTDPVAPRSGPQTRNSPERR